MPSFIFTGVPTITSSPAANDDSDKIPTTHWVNYAMSLIYLPITTAASTYLTITNASSTYATITNLNLKANSASPTFTGTVTLPSTVNFTTNPASGTGTVLAIDGSGNLVTTTSSALTQTATSTNATYYLTFVASSSTGTFTPLVYSQIMCNPNIGLIEVNNMKITSLNQGGSQVSLLGRDSAGNVIDGFMSQTASSANTDFPVGFIQYAGTGLFAPLSETSGAFTFNPSTLKLKTSKLQITSVPTGTQQYLLAVDSSGNVIQGTGSGGVSSFSGGATGLLPNTATTGAVVLSGTLSVANGGTGNTTGTLAYLGNTQTFSGVNTFSDQMTLTKGFDLTLGSINSFVVRNSSSVTQFTVTNTGVTMGNLVMTGTVLNMSSTSPNAIYSGDNLLISASATTSKNIYMTVAGTALQLDQYGLALSSSAKTLYCNNYEGLSALGFNMLGGNDSTFKINNTLNISSQPVGFDFQTMYGSYPSYTTNARISGLGVGTNTLYSFGANALNIQNSSTINYGATTAHQFKVNSVGAFAISADGLWMPSSSSRSFYITDTFPYTASTTYGRYFGVGGTIYQDFYNAFIWRRDPGLTGTGVVQLASLDGNGLTLSNAVNVGQPQLTFAGSGTPNIKCTGSGYNWFIGGTQIGYFDYPGGHWRISTNLAQKLILCSGGQNSLQCGNGGLGNYPVEVYGARVVNGPYWQYTGGGATWSAVSRDYNIGLYVQYAISADGGYLLASDERIKQDIKLAESGSLEVISTIPIKSYSYIDPFVNGCSTAYSVIAQDIQRTYPEAITKGDGFIPDMFVKCNWIHVDEKQIEINIPKPHTVKAGDKVKLILEDSTYKEAIVTLIKNETTFIVEKWDEFKLEISDELFVYGKYINDFLRVDKIRLGVLALAGTKELHQIVKLQQAKIEEQSIAINTLSDSVKTLTEHLTKLTNMFNELTKK